MNNNMILTSKLLEIDPKIYCEQIESFIVSSFNDSNCKGIVVPISGGLDSSVVASLCVRAIGKDKVIGLMLPVTFGNPEANDYGKLIANHLKIKTIKKNISPILRGLRTSSWFDSMISGRERMKGVVLNHLHKQNHTTVSHYLDTLKGTLNPKSRKLVTRVNSIQRVRLIYSYKIANSLNYLLAGASNKTEQMVGLYVKYGIDDAADIMPLRNLYRSQLLQLAEYMKLPNDIIHRAPNPDILPGVIDKYVDYFGIDSHVVDLILMGIQLKMSPNDIAIELGIDLNKALLIEEVVELNIKTQYKAIAPEFIKKNHRTIEKTFCSYLQSVFLNLIT